MRIVPENELSVKNNRCSECKKVGETKVIEIGKYQIELCKDCMEELKKIIQQEILSDEYWSKYDKDNEDEKYRCEMCDTPLEDDEIEYSIDGQILCEDCLLSLEEGEE